MEIDVLCFEGCPSWQTSLENLKAALAAEGIAASIRLVLVKNDAEARRLKFLGSPSFHMDGADWWPEARDSYHLSCRVYATPEGLKGAPTVAMLREKLRERAPGKHLN